MPLRSHLFRKVTIIGVGLIGGSVGLGIKKRKLAREVVGLSQRHSTLMAALRSHAIDHAYHDVKKAVHNTDLVILAAPVSIITGMLSMIGPHLKRNCIVTDVGSTKTTIVGTAHDALPGSAFFVGSHPLAGSEKTGVEHASADLFEKSVCVMTPTDQTNRMAREKVRQLWTRLGATVKFYSPKEHDELLSFISHLPHLVAYALMESIPDKHLEHAAQGLKDTTRVASSSPQMWNDICMSNPQNIVAALDALVNRLASMRKSIAAHESKNLLAQFQAAKAKRDRIR